MRGLGMAVSQSDTEWVKKGTVLSNGKTVKKGYVALKTARNKKLKGKVKLVVKTRGKESGSVINAQRGKAKPTSSGGGVTKAQANQRNKNSNSDSTSNPTPPSVTEINTEDARKKRLAKQKAKRIADNKASLARDKKNTSTTSNGSPNTARRTTVEKLADRAKSKTDQTARDNKQTKTTKKDPMTGRTSSIPAEMTRKLNALRKKEKLGEKSRNMEKNQSRNSNTDTPEIKFAKQETAIKKKYADLRKKERLTKLKKEKKDNQTSAVRKEIARLEKELG